MTASDATRLPEEVVAPTVPLLADFQAFYAEHFHRAVGLAYALCGDRSSAEELAQEAFIAAYRRWAEVGRYDDPAQWVRRVIANRAVSRFRRLAREGAALTRLRARPEPTMDELDSAADEFWSLVRSLPTRQAQAVALHYRDDLSVAAIAEVLDCRPNTVKAHLFKARRSLALALGATLDASETP